MNNKRDIVVTHQAQTYVYVGDTGYIVVKQENFPEEDSVILIDPQNAIAVAEAIKGYIKEAEAARLEWLESEAE